MRTMTSMLMLLVFMCPLVAAPPEITASRDVYGHVGDWVEVNVQTTGKWVRYKSADGNLKIFPSELLKDPKKILVSSLEAKSYTIFAYTGNDDGGADTEIVVTFVQRQGPFPNPQPNPPIPPGPNPPIPPIPAPVVIEGAWVIVIEETMERTPAIAQVLGDTRFWKELPVAGSKHYDINNPAAVALKYDLMAKQTNIPLPVMMIVDRNGKLIRAKALPPTTTGVRDFIKETTGK